MTTIRGRSLASPYFVAAGTLGWGLEARAEGRFPRRAGAFVTPSLGFETSSGDVSLVEVEDGASMLYSRGPLSTVSTVEKFLSFVLPAWRRAEMTTPVFVSVRAETPALVASLLSRLVASPLTSWEPFVGFELDLAAVADASSFLAAARTAAPESALVAKVGVAAPALDELVAAARAAHIDALAPTGPILAGSPDLPDAWMVGPALRPLAYATARRLCALAPELSIIGGGGIRDRYSAHAFLELGCVAVHVGSLHLIDPLAIDRFGGEGE